MDQVFQTVLSLLRETLSPHPQEFSPSVEWESILRELRNQTVEALPTNAISRIADEAVKQRQRATALNHVMNYQRHIHCYRSLAELLASNGIRFVFIKGLAVSRYYPQPEYHTLGDVDVLVQHEMYDAAKHLLLQHGYRQEECPYEKHDEFIKDGVVIELHKYFVSTNDIHYATYIEEKLQQGVMAPKVYNGSGFQLPFLPKLADGLMLLEHMSQHLESGIGLRHLLDWAVYVKHVLNDSFWNEEFSQAAEAAGLKTLACVAAKTCKLYLGLTGISWCDDADDETCNMLICHIFERGNFGRKTEQLNDKTKMLFSKNHRLIDWLRYLQSTGLRTIPFIKVHRWMRPFAWLCRGCILAKRVIVGHVSLSRLKADMAEGAEISSFLDRLGVRRVSEGRTAWEGDGFTRRKS